VANANAVLTSEWNRETVAHGLININTATWQALLALPMAAADPAVDPMDRMRVAADLLAYRDRLGPVSLGAASVGNFEFTQPRGDVIGNLIYGASVSVPLPDDQHGFAAAGEPAMLLRLRSNPGIFGYRAFSPTAYGYLLGVNGGDDSYPPLPMSVFCLSKLELRYTYAANLLAVNSDTYCAYIWVQLGPDPDPETRRRYMAIIDRSNCITDGDQPMVRAFAEVK